jgi:hypothetical protein
MKTSLHLRIEQHGSHRKDFHENCHKFSENFLTKFSLLKSGKNNGYLYEDLFTFTKMYR